MKNNIKKNTGVTLISLVVTIIVMIIMATVTISTISGENGIIEKSQAEKNRREQELIKDLKEINSLQQQIAE